MRLVLDTNVVLDLLHFSDPSTAPLLLALQKGKAQAYTDTECLAELARVSAYPAFHLSVEEQQSLMQRFLELTQCCAEGEAPAEAALDASLPRCRDPDDQKFLTLAARCRADWLLTRDKLLLEVGKKRRGLIRFSGLSFQILTAQAVAGLLSAIRE